MVLAMGLPYWIVSGEGIYYLMVRPEDFEAAIAEIARFDEERRADRESAWREFEALRLEPEPQSAPRTSLVLFCVVLGVFFMLQAHFSAPLDWAGRGEADSAAILHGAWWRTFTALTLHGDFGHLAANMIVGTIFGWALLPHLGAGWTWLGMLLSGAVGNWLNAWGHNRAHEQHFSIGASTAVFGGLGILVGWQTLVAIRFRGFRRAQGRTIREVWIPIGAGLALLAYLGTGGEGQHVDVMAHLFGMAAGGVLGALLAWTRLPQRTPPAAQTALGIAAVALLIAAWWFALR